MRFNKSIIIAIVVVALTGINSVLCINKPGSENIDKPKQNYPQEANPSCECCDENGKCDCNGKCDDKNCSCKKDDKKLPPISKKKAEEEKKKKAEEEKKKIAEKK
ncbi:hypothetical protein NEOKW01_0824 [Nematocida sp. AWRm80]|nr:hypothetical protein NEOKW01_0824 [Nematocida sp. AWRm80]